MFRTEQALRQVGYGIGGVSIAKVNQAAEVEQATGLGGQDVVGMQVIVCQDRAASMRNGGIEIRFCNVA